MSDAIEMGTMPAVATLADTDKLAVLTSAGGKSITGANLAKYVAGKKEIRLSGLQINANDWIRVAKIQNKSYAASAILSVHHNWSSGTPTPLICIVTSSGGTNTQFNAERLTRGDLYLSSYSSFVKARFVHENGVVFVEVKFRNSGYTSTIYTAISCDIQMELVVPTISTVAEDDPTVLKTIDLMEPAQSGGYNKLSDSKLYFARAYGSGRRAA